MKAYLIAPDHIERRARVFDIDLQDDVPQAETVSEILDYLGDGITVGYRMAPCSHLHGHQVFFAEYDVWEPRPASGPPYGFLFHPRFHFVPVAGSAVVVGTGTAGLREVSIQKQRVESIRFSYLMRDAEVLAHYWRAMEWMRAEREFGLSGLLEGLVYCDGVLAGSPGWSEKVAEYAARLYGTEAQQEPPAAAIPEKKLRALPRLRRLLGETV